MLGEGYIPQVDQPQLFPNQILENPENTITCGCDENGSISPSTPAPGTKSGTDDLLNTVNDVESSLLFKRGYEEGSKY